MRLFQVILSLFFLASLSSSSPHNNRRLGRPPPLRIRPAEEGNHPLLPPENEDVETMLPQTQQEETFDPIAFTAAEFDLYDGREDERIELMFNHPQADMSLAIDPRRDATDVYATRRRAAEVAFRHGTYQGNYQLDRRNDYIRHLAMEYLSNWTDDRVGSGAFYHLNERIIYTNKLMRDNQARGSFNMGHLPIFYRDRRGYLHFIVYGQHNHPGPFPGYINYGHDPDAEYRRNVADQL